MFVSAGPRALAGQFSRVIDDLPSAMEQMPAASNGICSRKAHPSRAEGPMRRAMSW